MRIRQENAKKSKLYKEQKDLSTSSSVLVFRQQRGKMKGKKGPVVGLNRCKVQSCSPCTYEYHDNLRITGPISMHFGPE